MQIEVVKLTIISLNSVEKFQKLNIHIIVINNMNRYRARLTQWPIQFPYLTLPRKNTF
ncbi:hypothetical protein ACVWYN_002575 [Pedobacter sp. UYP24]